MTALRERMIEDLQLHGFAEKTQEAYLRGSMRFIDVLDVERLLFALKSRYFDALGRYHRTVADMERLTGESLATAGENHGRQEP